MFVDYSDFEKLFLYIFHINFRDYLNKSAIMSVFEFDKSLLVRLEESTNVLQCKNGPVPASEVRNEWAYHVELQIEPAGNV